MLLAQWSTPLRQNLKLTKKLTLNLNLKKKKLSLGLGLVLGFGLVCTPFGKHIVGSFFWPYPLLLSALLFSPFICGDADHYLRTLAERERERERERISQVYRQTDKCYEREKYVQLAIFVHM